MARSMIGLFIIFGCWSIPGCSKEPQANSSNSASGAVVVVGPDTWDFGKVKDPGKVLRHEFTLWNRSNKDLTVSEVKRSCGCSSAWVDPKVIPSGAKATANVEIDTELVVGKKLAYILIVFDTPSVPPVSLRAEGTVEARFTVSIAPTIWTLPRNLVLGQTVERKFRVTAFSEEQGEPFEILAKCSGDELSIDGPNDWTPGEVRAAGFAREADLILTYRLSETASRDSSFTLEFEHHRKDLPIETFPVKLLVRRS